MVIFNMGYLLTEIEGKTSFRSSSLGLDLSELIYCNRVALVMQISTDLVIINERMLRRATI